MTRIFVRSWGASDWRRLLAKPLLHWVRGRSAMETAVSWEYAQANTHGLPEVIYNALNWHDDLKNSSLLIAIPEHKVPLNNARAPSQNDVWALLDSPSGHISMTVEGKVDEHFGETLGVWNPNQSVTKQARLDFLCQTLGINGPLDPQLRYQLFHRTASALIEANRFKAQIALMLVQSFREDALSWNDFSNFCELFEAVAIRNGFVEVQNVPGRPRLFLGWVDCPFASDNEMAKVI